MGKKFFFKIIFIKAQWTVRKTTPEQAFEGFFRAVSPRAQHIFFYLLLCFCLVVTVLSLLLRLGSGRLCKHQEGGRCHMSKWQSHGPSRSPDDHFSSALISQWTASQAASILKMADLRCSVKVNLFLSPSLTNRQIVNSVSSVERSLNPWEVIYYHCVLPQPLDPWREKKEFCLFCVYIYIYILTANTILNRLLECAKRTAVINGF